MDKVANKETKQPPASLLPKPNNLPSFTKVKWIVCRLGWILQCHDANLKKSKVGFRASNAYCMPKHYCFL
jgi:hypothetical protein